MSFAQHPLSTDVVDAAAPGAKPTKITFDDVYLYGQGATSMPDYYGDLSWLGPFDVMNPAILLKGRGDSGCGFFKGDTSGKQVAFNDSGDPVGIQVTQHMDVKSVEMTAAFDKTLVVDIYAYRGTTQVAHDRVTLTDQKATLVKLDYKGVTEVDFVPGKGTHDNHFKDKGGYIAFDDLVVANVANGKAAKPADAAGLPHSAASGAASHDPSGHWPPGGGHAEALHMIHPIA